MLEMFHDIQSEDYDCLTFFPDYEEKALKIEGQLYKNPGEKIPGSIMGDWWHVILFKEGGESFTNLDNFDAILSEPLEYISQLIPQGWYGMVAKKTTTSEKFIQKTLDILNKSL
jgi:hypothetical protein